MQSREMMGAQMCVLLSVLYLWGLVGFISLESESETMKIRQLRRLYHWPKFLKCETALPNGVKKSSS